jgi:Family of unknown function (DUF6193)
VRQVLDVRWSQEVGRVTAGLNWVDRSIAPLIVAAAADADLRALFPFTSHNRLCFSRCSGPYTLDCPCIAAHLGRYAVLATWAVGDQPAPVLLETDDVAEAITAVVERLPPDRRVWLGNAKK